jgi:Sulfotransferase family
VAQRVLYIGGRHRSGSTLLDLMLGQVPSLFAAGELRWIWRKGLVDNRRCGCGIPFRDCAFWRDVGEAAFNGWQNVDVDEITKLFRRLDRLPSIPLLLATRSRDDPGSPVNRYAAALGTLLSGIRTVSGAEVVVDSSKSPAHALLLERVDGVDLRAVHLVRDSRGVVFSGLRGDARRKAVSRAPRDLGIVRVSAQWLVYNALAPTLHLARVPYMWIRYEDLVSAPEKALHRILDHAGTSWKPEDLSFLQGSRLTLEANHTVYGNRLRFTVGGLAIRADEDWKRDMPRRSRSLVTAMTFPLLLRYGYPVWSRRIDAGTERQTTT